MQKLLLIGAAGALGALARYGLAGVVQRIGGVDFPWGTLTVNILGSFLFGVVWSLSEDRLIIGSETRLIVLTGFMGAFTTFSTFMFETGALLREAQWELAALNLAGQNTVGLTCLFLGLIVGRLF
ncbi:MAG: fluoride efflux transporter CrcB [Anaerolineae bacterium]|nr:fluoride efflux transporter CrcB [Anaerolineae bacterium]